MSEYTKQAGENPLQRLVRHFIFNGPEATLRHYGGREGILDLLKQHHQGAKPGHSPYSPDDSDLEKCNTVDDVKRVIATARAENKVVRVAGAQHSAPRAIFAQADQPHLKIKLEGGLRKITVLEEDKGAGYIIVRAGAGCNLGIDPSDPASTAENSFNRQMDKLGYALPILGGMSHHTIGGFMMTSTAGGSFAYGFSDVLEAIEFVDGQGREQFVVKGSDEFNAAAVSMGLFGIITHVTLRLRANYLVKGVEEVVATRDSILADAATLQAAFKAQPYVHSVWFPEEGVERVLQFRADQAPNTEPIQPYQHVLQQTWMNYAVALVLQAVNLLKHVNTKVTRELAAFLLNLLNPLGRKEFCDHWYIALPNDDQALIDSVIRVQFTEVWIDAARTPEVLSALRKLFKTNPSATGNFGVEIYGAKKSPFWMSMSYERDVIRVDPYWWEYNLTGNLQDFFTHYWNVLLTIPTARLHWGKHFPEVGAKFGALTMGPDYVAQAYPRFGDWLKMREKYDPEQLFMSSYWRGMLGVSSARTAAVEFKKAG